MNDPSGLDHGEVRAAAASAIAPDPESAKLLERHAAGEKLTSQEYGRVGWIRSRLRGFLSGKSNSNGEPAKPGAQPGNASAVATVAPAAPPDSSGMPVQPDADLVKRTTGTILTLSDSIARRYVARVARKAFANQKQIDRLDRAAALPSDAKTLMVEVSPDALASIGLDPRRYPLTVFLGALGMWGGTVLLAVEELKEEIAKERASQLQAAQARPDPTKTAMPESAAEPFKQGSPS